MSDRGISFKYKGDEIAQLSGDGSIKLLTKNKLMEDDLEVDINRDVTIISKNVTQNGVYEASDDDADGYDEVTVNVPNTYTAGDEGKVVDNGGLVTQGSQTITVNDTYDTTLINEVVVDVAGGGGGSKNILKGTNAPTSADGVDGDIYLQYIGIPSSYTQVEYIEGDGSQYIDTNLVADTETEIEVDFSIEANVNSWQFVFGANSSNVNNSFLFGINGITNTTYQRGTNVYSDTAYSFNLGDVYSVKTHKKKIYLNDSLLTQVSNFIVSTPVSLALFAVHQSSGFNNILSAYKAYGAKIWQDGELVRFFVPCVRNSDSVAGFFDVINQQFYASSGNDDYIAGQSATPLDNILSAYCKVNGTWQALVGTDIDDVNTEGGGESDYELLDYIQSDGTQYIDLGIGCGSNDSVTAMWQLVSGNTNYKWIFGAEYGTNSYVGLQVAVPTTYVRWFDGTNPANLETVSLSKRSFSADTSASATQNNVYAFAINVANDNPLNYTIKAKLYMLAIGDNYFLPCRRKSDGVCGLWDSTNARFLTDSASGNAFVAGNVIY